MLKIVTIIAIAFSFSFVSALSFSGNGSGTEEDPYQITNVHQLQEMNDDLDACYILMNDIDASETRTWNVGDHDNDPATPDSAMGFVPIGDFIEENPTAGFTGTLDGQGYSINDLFINRPNEDNIGLFGCIADGGAINNVSIEHASVTSYNNVGIIVGISYAYEAESVVILKKCCSGGIVSGNEYVGGFCGNNSAIEGRIEINDCFSDSYVYGNKYLGGFCGANYSRLRNSITILNYCFSEGIVVGNSDYVGGFCGSNYAFNGTLKVNYSYSLCNTQGASYVGGFCGYNGVMTGNSSILYCHSSGVVFGSRYSIGGFCGTNDGGGNSANSLISFCYSTGDATATGINDYLDVGGFCGENTSSFGYATITYCFSEGNAKGQGNFNNIGGFCGTNYSAEGSCLITDCFALGNSTAIIGNDTEPPLRNNVGNFIGSNEGGYAHSWIVISRCYSIGVPNQNKEICGFLGNERGPGYREISDCYWDVETSGFTTSNYADGKTTAEMMMQATFVDWDFDDVWCIGEHETYPQLQHFVDCDTLVSVPTIESNMGIEIYPNPATSHITISLSEEFISAPEIDIIDYLGNVIRWTPSGRWSPSDKTITFNTSSLSPGVYFLRIRSGEKVEVRKFVVYR